MSSKGVSNTTECFHKASSMTCEKYIASIKFSSFKEKYPEFYKSQPELLKDTFQQFKEQLENNIKEDLQYLFTEKNVVEKIAALEELTKKAREENKKVSWRPSGDPRKDIRDHRYRVKLKHKKVLELILKDCKSQNEQVLKQARENHEEILSMEKEVFDLEEQNEKKLEAITENVTSMESVMEGLQSLAEEN